MKENQLKNHKSTAIAFFFKGLKDEFETAVVNEPSVFEPVKFYCIIIFLFLTIIVVWRQTPNAIRSFP